MEVLIHACPERMWYVEGYLIPELERQGADRIRVWNDAEKRGNLYACMEAFAAMEGDGATWHLQDDVLPCRDFVKRCRQHDAGVVFGFCCEYFLDNPEICGPVYLEDAWHSFQCVRIPDPWARECAEWFFSGAWRSSPCPELPVLKATNRGDDTFFREFLIERHGMETGENLKPNLVEHVDLLIGGSLLHQYRDYLARAYYWEDREALERLREWLRRRKT